MAESTHFSACGFRKMDLRDDPLGGAYGLAWYERKPSSLTADELRALIKAVGEGRIEGAEYCDWSENVR